MKCSIDQTEMEKGYLTNNGGVWMNDSGLTKRIDTIMLTGKNLLAWKCAKCSKVELTTEENK